MSHLGNYLLCPVRSQIVTRARVSQTENIVPKILRNFLTYWQKSKAMFLSLFCLAAPYICYVNIWWDPEMTKSVYESENWRNP